MGHRPCLIHCPKEGGAAASVVAAIAVAAYAIAQVAVVLAMVLAVAAAVAVVVVVVSVPVTRRLARRVCVPRWSAAYTPPVKRQRRTVRPALARGPLALENKTITVTPDMFVAGAVKEEAR